MRAWFHLGPGHSAVTPKAGTCLLLQLGPPLPSFWMDLSFTHSPGLEETCFDMGLGLSLCKSLSFEKGCTEEWGGTV